MRGLDHGEKHGPTPEQQLSPQETTKALVGRKWMMMMKRFKYFGHDRKLTERKKSSTKRTDDKATEAAKQLEANISYVDEAKEAETHGDTRALYKTLRSLGVKDQGVIEEKFFSPEEYRGHFMKVSAERYERAIHELLTTAASTTKRTDDKATEAAKQLEANISYVEFKREISHMRDSAPGIDGVTVNAMKSLAENNKQELYHCMLRLLDSPPRTWPDETKEEWVVLLHKKGSRNDLNNYRGVCLLPLVSPVIARIFATRIRVWAETLDILGENQNGFRTGRSTCDAIQIVLRIDEETRRVLGYCEEAKQNRPGAVLLDITKAYPRFNRPLLWSVLANLDMTSKVLELLKGLNEHTCYRIKGKEGLSSEWIPERPEGGVHNLTNPVYYIPTGVDENSTIQKKRKSEGTATGVRTDLDMDTGQLLTGS